MPGCGTYLPPAPGTAIVMIAVGLKVASPKHYWSVMKPNRRGNQHEEQYSRLMAIVTGRPSHAAAAGRKAFGSALLAELSRDGHRGAQIFDFMISCTIPNKKRAH